MLDMQYAITYSPKGSDTLLFDDVESRKRSAGTTTFDMLTRRFTTTFTSPSYRTSDENKSTLNTLDNPIRQIKIKIVQYNPMIYCMLQEYLVVGQCYTDVTVCYMMNQFIDKTIRIPELRNDIMNHRLVYTNYFPVRSSTTTSSIFAYLTGESSLSYASPLSTSPTTALHLKRPVAVNTRLTTSSSSTSDSTSSSHDSRELSLPSLESPGNSYDPIIVGDNDEDEDEDDQTM